MLKILQARLQQYVNCELPGVQDGFRKGRGTIDQIANIHWIIKKKQEISRETSISPLRGYWSGVPLPFPHIHTTIYKIDN